MGATGGLSYNEGAHRLCQNYKARISQPFAIYLGDYQGKVEQTGEVGGASIVEYRKSGCGMTQSMVVLHFFLHHFTSE